MSVASEEWMLLGECRDHPNPDIFTANPDYPTEQHMVDEAKKVCRSCPVRRECLDWAIRTGDRHVIAGGLDKNQRRGIRQRELRRLQRARRKAA
jgi:WhiB family redox-sensing transcriptional regulator